MNKKIIILVVFTLLTVLLMAQRVYTQKVVAADPAANIYDIVTNTSTSTSPLYAITADIQETPGEVLTTVAGNPDGQITVPYTSLRINRLGTAVVTVLQLATFPTPWVAGQTVEMKVTEIATGDFTTWTLVIPAGGTAITILNPAQAVPPMPGGDTWTYNLTVNGPATYTVTGPGTYSHEMPWTFTCGPNATDINDLIGNWTASAAPAGFHWVMNPIAVAAGDFVAAKTDKCI